MAREVPSTGPHFRAADLETADRKAALEAKGITLRALILGAAFVMGLAWATPYIEEYLNGTLVASNHLPVSALLVLLAIALLLNVGLLLHRLPIWARAVYLAGYTVLYWGFWMWFQYERAHIFVGEGEGEPLAVASRVFAVLGYGAGLAFFGAGSVSENRLRRLLGVISGVLFSGMGVVVVLTSGPESGVAQAGQVEILSILLMLIVAGVAAYMAAAQGPFDRAESLVILAMTMVMAAIPNIGLMGYLIPVMTAPYFYASPENGWTERLHQHIRPWLSPQDNPEAGYMPVKWLYDGLPKEQTIPWEAWVKPLLFWSLFTLLIYGIMFFLSAILRRQWSDKERLPFPLAQVPLAMTEDYRPGKMLAPFFRDKLVWVGIAIPFLLHSYNSLHDFFAGVPRIPLHFTNVDVDYLTEPPWYGLRPIRIYLYPSVIGLTYLISLEVAFSLWFFYFIQKAMVLIGVQMGYGTSGWSYGSVEGWRSMTVCQGFGGMLAMVLLGAFMARGHLKEVARKALSPLLPAEDIDDSVEPVGYKLAFWGFWACVAGAVVWLLVAGMSLIVVLVLMALFVLTLVGLSRLVAEGGLFYVQSANTAPQTMLEASVGTAPLGARNLTVGGFLHGIYMFDLRSMVMPSIIHSFKIAGEGGVKRRHMALAVVLALVLGLFFSYVSFLYISYKVGGSRLSRWFYVQWPVIPFRDANNRIKKDISQLTESSRTVISETRALLSEKPWAVEDKERDSINAAISELEDVLKDVETTTEMRSRLTSLKEHLRGLHVRLGHGRLRKSLTAVKNPEERETRDFYALSRSARFINTIEYDREFLPNILDEIEATLSRWQQTSYQSEETLYELDENLAKLGDMLSEVSQLASVSDESLLAEEIRSLASRAYEMAGEGGGEALKSDEMTAIITQMEEKVGELIDRWNVVRGIEMLKGPVSSALGKHENKVSLASLRERALATLGTADSLYQNSAFVAGRPAVVRTNDWTRVLVSSGNGTFYGIEPATGDPAFKRNLTDIALRQPVTTDFDENGKPEALIIGKRGTVYLMDPFRGRLLWSTSIDEDLTAFAGPGAWLGQKCFLVGTASGRVLVLALRGGKRVAQYQVSEGSAVSALALGDGMACAGFSGGAVVLKQEDTEASGRRLELSAVEGAEPADSPEGFVIAERRILLATARGLVITWEGRRGRIVEYLGKGSLATASFGEKMAVVIGDGIALFSAAEPAMEKMDAVEGIVAAGRGSDSSLLMATSGGDMVKWTPEGGSEVVANTGFNASCAPVLLDAEGQEAQVIVADTEGVVHSRALNGADAWKFGTPRRKKADVYWYAPDWVALAWTATGMGVYSAFTFLRQRVMWWPHPIGYVFMMSKDAYRKLWFSFLLGWFCKFVILKYLGFKTYYKMRGFFIGVVVGEVMAGGLWIFIDFIKEIHQGWPIHIN